MAQPTAPDSVAVGATVSKVAVTLPAVTAGELATMFEVAAEGTPGCGWTTTFPQPIRLGRKGKINHSWASYLINPRGS
jgi:hypothetical protein